MVRVGSFVLIQFSMLFKYFSYFLAFLCIHNFFFLETRDSVWKPLLLGLVAIAVSQLLRLTHRKLIGEMD